MCAYDIYYVWWFCKQNWASFHVGCLCCCPIASSHAIPHSSHASQRLHRTKVVLKAYFNIQNSDNTNETLFENIFIVISSLQWHSSENCFFDNLIVLVSLLCSQLHHLQPSTTLTQTRSHESRKQKKNGRKKHKKKCAVIIFIFRHLLFLHYLSVCRLFQPCEYVRSTCITKSFKCF